MCAPSAHGLNLEYVSLDKNGNNKKWADNGVCKKRRKSFYDTSAK